MRMDHSSGVAPLNAVGFDNEAGSLVWQAGVEKRTAAASVAKSDWRTNDFIA
jgi:hypothetical protein